ncbi:two component transcriptional regulator, LuxR family protein (plasmid) [Leptolyngbya boryana NIES-2135]|jgi:DNA-binding NarL/FixJ family response regulator|uniref:Two component transcriptional regulator, LuxR family protein n=1 Tax=Leptolyngbya boryana NIES-2135 TaxID=1973484 RepID=A0A1Z4JS13_LEPBY|nr:MULTISPECIES: LuxR C-terminal-related transcriptional regulator [Leptolyngbya]MBD2373081.1 helix-turn-helix transcriptional regulator [Leptolyngbya sp. FACHB-238]MBD2397164.1 helix-turn-helix transcriptional regulator [Leptolyngbya sp. FACHB-239]MBD2404030.1 helix-turn-helix transcriptional regulator [Leptolyngbya sp. FACHB-402]BAY59500.1 two component transcriptional regulator, LuxR family protein [Leptolyngbya boryana NIES-2135]
MTLISLWVEDDGCTKFPTQIDFLGDSSVNRALLTVAQEVNNLLQKAYPPQTDNDAFETIAIRAIEPEYMKLIIAEPLTARELEVLQLIVDGYNNLTIANKLYITKGTVKTHVRSIFGKLCVNDRTQAAIWALRSGLVH